MNRLRVYEKSILSDYLISSLFKVSSAGEPSTNVAKRLCIEQGSSYEFTNNSREMSHQAIPEDQTIQGKSHPPGTVGDQNKLSDDLKGSGQPRKPRRGQRVIRVNYRKVSEDWQV